MHVCMIDENSHYSQPAKAGESNLFSLRKRAPIESLCNFHRSKLQLPFARTSPSTFLFLLSSQCQRADPEHLAASTSCESNRFQNSCTKHIMPGCPEARSFLPETPEQWERTSLDVVQCGGLYSSRLRLSTPFFHFLDQPGCPKPVRILNHFNR